LSKQQFWRWFLDIISRQETFYSLMPEPKTTEIRGDRRSVILGCLIAWVMRGWTKTLRFQIVDRCGVITPGAALPPVIFALWHNRIFTIPPIWWRTGGHLRKSVVLTSASKDGAILASAMAALGIGAVRGSSSRRAVAALIGMKRALRDGLDVCITPDGPRGPRGSFHPGIIKLAQTTGAAIVPIHVHYAAAWRLNTWDRLVLPKPFSRVTVIFDETLVVPAQLSEAAFEAEVRRVQNILRLGADDL
jgi:lysophospholipid acyltransferase (LPLAT)-like uncharacterized protein